LIAALLITGALLPRPYPEYSFVDLGKLGSRDRDASHLSPGGREPGKGEGRSGQQGAKEGQGNASGKGGDSGGQGQAQGQGGQGREQGQGGGGKSQGQDSSSQGNQPGQGQDQASQNPPAGQNQSSTPKPGEHTTGEKNADADSTADASSGTNTTLPSFSSVFTALSTILKWIVFIIIGLIVAFFLVRALLRFFTNFTDWAHGLSATLERLWRGLFGWWNPRPDTAGDEREQAERRLPRPFSAFHNPFHSGMGGSPEELVRYSFEALEAWAWEHGLARDGDDTPLEFADRVGMEVSELGADARHVAALYARAAYARGRLSPSSMDVLRQFWQRLETIDQPRPEKVAR
jgi:hypothetical protein